MDQAINNFNHQCNPVVYMIRLKINLIDLRNLSLLEHFKDCA